MNENRPYVLSARFQGTRTPRVHTEQLDQLGQEGLQWNNTIMIMVYLKGTDCIPGWICWTSSWDGCIFHLIFFDADDCSHCRLRDINTAFVFEAQRLAWLVLNVQRLCLVLSRRKYYWKNFSARLILVSRIQRKERFQSGMNRRS